MVARALARYAARAMADLLFLFGGAFVIGLSGAMMPGPVLTATIGETLRTGFRAGPLIVLGHALVEAALLALVIGGLSGWLQQPGVLGALGLVGGSTLVLLGLQTIRTSGAAARTMAAARAGNASAAPRRNPVATGAVLSLSNPYWMLWWATIGLHYAAQALQRGPAGLGAFYAGHILSDLAWYSLVAAAVAAGRRVCPAWLHRLVLVACGLALAALGAFFLGDGLARIPVRGAEAGDQGIGRRVVCERRVGGQLGQDRGRQLLAQFDAPLIERVDVPEHALGEDFVFVERDQLTERRRG